MNGARKLVAGIYEHLCGCTSRVGPSGKVFWLAMTCEKHPRGAKEYDAKKMKPVKRPKVMAA